MKMKLPLTFGLMAVLFFSTGCSSENEAEWQPLFNGEDIEDWTIKIRGYEVGDNYANTFRVEDGLIKIRYDRYDDKFEEKFGHIFHKETFSTYLLGAEYRFVGEQLPDGPGWAYRNSGLMLHGQEPETMEIDQDFPNSIEVQLLGGSGQGDRTTANICTPGTQFVKDGEVVTTHCMNSDSRTYHGDQWVRVDVLVIRDSLMVHYVNGEEVLRYEQPQLDNGTLLSEGTISLQSESHPTDYRTVEIVDLKEFEDDPAALQELVDRLLEKRNEIIQ